MREWTSEHVCVRKSVCESERRFKMERCHGEIGGDAERVSKSERKCERVRMYVRACVCARVRDPSKKKWCVAAEKKKNRARERE